MHQCITGRAIVAPAVAALGLAVLATPAFAQSGPNDGDAAGSIFGGRAVYSLSNEADGNRLVVVDRRGDGSFEDPRYIPTGGLGSGGGLGNQGALDLHLGGLVIYAVNAGSDSISVLLNLPIVGPVAIQQVDSGGGRPVSLDAEGGLLFVVNAGGADGGADSIAGFRTGFLGLLDPIVDSIRPLSAANTGPAQIGFDADGDQLIVTEKVTNALTVFNVDHWGRPSDPISQPSSGETPFGFMIDDDGYLVVSEAFGGMPGASAVSTYELHDDGRLGLLEASVPTNQTAACWVALTANGRFAYTTNTADSTVTGFEVDSDGGLEILDADGVTGVTGDGGESPTDAVVLANRVLYVLNRDAGEVLAFRVRPDGSLQPLDLLGGLPGVPTGLVVR